ncbi:MAG: hypothetical protein OXC63_03755 [Aestuariivita sp.]|nr:hypothetical protein [Aestuariivita sp.]
MNESNLTIWENIRRNWPHRHKIISDTSAFVVTEKTHITTTDQVASLIGLGIMPQTFGLVVELGHHPGFQSNDTWEWLRNAAINDG